jgi:hypothetical protein
MSLMGQFDYNRMDINDGTLTELGIPGGNTSVWSVTLNPMIRINPRGRFGMYLIGGGGVYHRTIQFTQPTVVTTPVFDPFFGVFYPVSFSATEVTDQFTQTKAGVNGGLGLEWKLGERRTSFYAEARYHQMYTSPRATTYVPVTFGFRW